MRTPLLLTAALIWTNGASLPAAEAAAAKPRIVDASRFSTLQTALDAVPAAGGLVKLPPGTFELTTPLLLTRENTRIVGAGAATHIINRNEAGEPALILRPAGYPKNQRLRIWRVQVANFRIEGNPKSGDGLRAERINEIYVHGMSIDHHGGCGINLINC